MSVEECGIASIVYGAKVLVDGAQAISLMRVDMQSLDCDFFVFSGQKVFGPIEIGAVYGNRKCWKACRRGKVAAI